MTMLPVCSATTSCSSHSQVSLIGGLQHLLSYRKAFDVRCVAEERVALELSSGNHLQCVSLKAEVSTSFSFNFIRGREQFGSMGFNESTTCEFSDNWTYSSSSVSSGQHEAIDYYPDRFAESANFIPDSANPQIVSAIDFVPDVPASVSDSLTTNNSSLSSLKTSIEDVNESINASVNKGESALKNLIDGITSSVTSALKDANEAVDNVVTKVISSVDRIEELSDNKFTELSNDLKEASNKAGGITVDVLRRSLFQIEDSLNQGATYVVYAYGSAKNLLFPEIQNVLSLYEERVLKILKPVGTAFQQFYVALEGLEKSVGVDPNDPIVPFVLLIGTSATLWGSYWLVTYSGYAGDLSPKSTLELLTGKENAVLIDVRPEDRRERDGVPDLRRAARFRCVNVSLPEVDGSVRKLLKSGKDLDDTLIAAVIRNLKIIQDRSKVVVMDADGARSKSIARSLKKLGVKQPYLVQGGFRSWVKEGLPVKELKPETALTIINEEAEAILEEINPTPVKVAGYGMGFIAALFALLEWEKTLQLIGIVGLGQTIYRRIASYKDAEDFKQDLRLLQAPVRLGGLAISWAAGKLETNGIGLPTSPSSLDVQNRVLQAAAKHESEAEENQDPTRGLTVPVNDNVDMFEA